MNTQEKKFEKKLISELTLGCEAFKNNIDGFMWLTHIMDFSKINQSLKIICVFNTNESLNNAIDKDQITHISASLNKRIKHIGVNLKNPIKHIFFDTEENCNNINNGDWNSRLRQYK